MTHNGVKWLGLVWANTGHKQGDTNNTSQGQWRNHTQGCPEKGWNTKGSILKYIHVLISQKGREQVQFGKMLQLQNVLEFAHM